MNRLHNLSCLFLLYLFSLSSGLIFDEDIFFLNVLYASIKRSESTMAYLECFCDFEEAIGKLHTQILSKMRNPSKYCNLDLLDLYEKKQSDYLILVKEVFNNYHYYKNIINAYNDVLTDEQKKVLQEIKKNTAYRIINQISNLEEIINGVKNFFHNLKESGYEDKFQFIDIKDFFINIKEKADLYFYYQKMYVGFDNALIAQYKYFSRLKKIFNHYYKSFWLIVEQNRLQELITAYNYYMSQIEKNSIQIKEIIFNWENSSLEYSEKNLPTVVYNKFL